MTLPDNTEGPNKIEVENTAKNIEENSVKQTFSDLQRNRRKTILTVDK